MHRIWYTLILIIYITAANAQDDDTIRYYQAYRVCATHAQNRTVSECNYAKSVENYYTTCMTQNGYSDSEETIPKDRYPDYLKTYRKCTTIANNAAQQKCNYGSIYKKHYDVCMYEYGFNSEGDPINKPQNHGTKRENNPDNSQTPDKSGPLTNFLESIL